MNMFMGAFSAANIVECFPKILYNELRKNRYSIISTFIFGILSYFFIFANKLPNFDDIYFMFSLGTGLPLGRWGLDILAHIIPKYSMPWFNGIVSMLIISVALCLLIHIFEIKNTYLQVILSALVVTFPGQLAVFANMFTSIPYAFSLLLSVCSLWFFKKETWTGFFWGSLFLVSAISIYQAFLAFVVSFLIVIITQKMIKHDDIKNILMSGIKILIAIIISVVSYFCITKILLHTYSVSFSFYAQDRLPHGFIQIWEGIFRCYRSFFLIFSNGGYGLIYSKLSKFLYLLIISLTLLSFFWNFFKRGQKGKLIYFSILLIIMPFSVNMLAVLSCYAIHTLTLFGFISLYFLIGMALDNKLMRRQLYDIVMISMSCIVFSNIVYANKKSFQWHLQYENYYAYMVTLLTRIQMLPEFDKTSRLAIIGGNFEKVYMFGEFGLDKMYRQNIDWMIDEWRNQFIRYYGGFDIQMATMQEKVKIIMTDEYKKMNVYPYHGSIKKIGDCIVVKMKSFGG